MNIKADSFLRDLFAQLGSERPRIDEGRWCAHNALVGTIVLGGALVCRFSGRPVLLSSGGFAFTIAIALGLVVAAIVPLVRPALVRAVLAVDGLLVLALTVAFSVACVRWAQGPTPTRSFRFLPGIITTGATYGAALWADFGPGRAHACRWRRAGLFAGLAMDAVVSALVVAAALRA